MTDLTGNMNRIVNYTFSTFFTQVSLVGNIRHFVYILSLVVNRLPCFRTARREHDVLVASNAEVARQQAEIQEEICALKQANHETILMINQLAIRLE